MNARTLVVLVLVVSAVVPAAAQSAKPIALHPDNPHYLLWRGKPTVLVTSGEHYGAVLNGEFDYVRYLDELRRCGLNLTRTFGGTYCENPQAFNITKNTLAPAPGKFLSPWARSDAPGYANGGNKFDLTKFDPAYFARLKDFLAQASKRGVVVELVLFCPMYNEGMWKLSPMNAANNVNDVGRLKLTEPLTLKNGKLLDVQLALVRKIVAECNQFDNLYYEICNEPYFGGVTIEWQHKIAECIAQAEKTLPNRHLIAQNIANKGAKVKDPHPAVSIFNFHYATPPTTVAENWHLNRPIGDDETGFKGTADWHYHMEAWEFLLAGGAIYSNLDYSFTVAEPDGTFFPLPPKQPGGGGRELRKQLRILKEFIESFDFVRMSPDKSVIVSGVPDKGAAWCLCEKGKAYAIYLRGSGPAKLVLDLPPGRYTAEWLNTWTGKIDKTQALDHKGGKATLESPAFKQDAALRLRRD